MRKTTFVTLSLMIFTILILFANTYSVRPSAITLANADSDVYEQQKEYGYLDRDDLINLPAHQIAFNFQNIPNGVLLPENNVTTNFPQQQLPIADPSAADIVTQYQIPSAAIPPSQQQLPIADPSAPDIVTQYQIPSAAIPPSQQQLPIADPATAADIVTQYQIPSAAIPPSQQQLPIADPATAADIVTQYQIPSAAIPPSQQQLPIADPATAADIVTQYQIPSAAIPPSQQQLPIADPATAADIVTQYQIPSAAIPPSQQQLPIADPATAADIVTQYQIPSAAIPPIPSNFGQYPMSQSYNTLVPEAFTSQFPYSYQDQQQEEQRPFNSSMTPPPTFQNPSTTGNNIFEDGSVGIENGRDLSKDGLQWGENIVGADSSRYGTNGNSTTIPVESTTSQPTEHNGVRPFIYSSTPPEDDPSLTLVPPINTTQGPFPNLSQTSQYLYPGDMTNFDNPRSNTVTDRPLNNVTNTISQSPSLSDPNFNVTSQDVLGSTLLDADVSNKSNPLVIENDTISSSTSHVTNTTPINKVQNVTRSNVTTPHLGGSYSNLTDPFSNETNSTAILQSGGTSLPNDAALLNSTTDAFLTPNRTEVAPTFSAGDALNPANETSASCDLHVALNETTTVGIDHDRTYDATIDQEALPPSSSTSSCDPELAVSGNTTYVTWTEGDEEDRQIFFAKSTDDGDTFARIVPMSTYAPSGSFNPQLAVSGNNVYVVWQEDDAITGNQDIFFKKSTDNGDTFTDEINLSKDPGGSGDPQIHVSGRNLYIVWDGTTPGANGIFLSKSTDGGDTFSSTSKLSNSRGFSFLPKIGKVSGNEVEVMWRNSENANDQVFSRKSTDGGASFTNIQRLSDEIKSSIWEEFSSHVNENPFNNVVPR